MSWKIPHSLFFISLLFGGSAVAAEAPKWQAEWQKTIEAAKKEGQISLYGGQEITHPEITAAFTKEFPFIKVLTTSGRGGDLLARIISERRADKYLADVIATGPNGPRMENSVDPSHLYWLHGDTAHLAPAVDHYEEEHGSGESAVSPISRRPL